MVNDLDNIVAKAIESIEITWSISKLRKLSFDIGDSILLDCSIPIERPTWSAFKNGYIYLFSEATRIECIHEAIRRTIIVLDYCCRPEYYELQANIENAVQLGKHQQMLQNQREEKGLLGKTVPKGKRDGKKPKVDYSVWTVKKK